MRGLVSWATADELFAMRFVHLEYGGNELASKEREIASAISLRRLRQNLHANGQSQKTPNEMRRLVGEIAGRSRVGSSAKVLLQSMRQRLQKAGHFEATSEARLRREGERIAELGEAEFLMRNAAYIEQDFLFPFFSQKFRNFRNATRLSKQTSFPSIS